MTPAVPFYNLVHLLVESGFPDRPGPGPAGSWAGPAWFKMLLGLGGNQGGGGGGGKGGPFFKSAIINFF